MITKLLRQEKIFLTFDLCQSSVTQPVEDGAVSVCVLAAPVKQEKKKEGVQMLYRIMFFALVLLLAAFVIYLTIAQAQPNIGGSVDLYLTAVGDNGNEGTATSYDVRYSIDSITTANFYATTKYNNSFIPKAAGEEETLKVVGLPSDAWLYFSVKACDEVPLCAINASNSVRKKTTDGTAPADINTLH